MTQAHTTTNTITLLLETADVALQIGTTPANVRALARCGALQPVATTPRGTRLYDEAAVARLRAARANREAAKA